MSYGQLPGDIIRLIAEKLPIGDICRLRRLSRHYNKSLNDDNLWSYLRKRDFDFKFTFTNCNFFLYTCKYLMEKERERSYKNRFTSTGAIGLTGYTGMIGPTGIPRLPDIDNIKKKKIFFFIFLLFFLCIMYTRKILIVYLEK